MQDVQGPLSAGTIIRERYLITSLIGKGTTGAVYLVKDQQMKQAKQNVFALKEILGLEQEERYQFVFNYVSLRQINHRALPRFYHIFKDDKRGRIYIVMDYIEGPDLETIWQQQPGQRFKWPEVEKIMLPIFDAVSYLHRQQPPIVHGDIKPVNIIMAQPEEQFKLVDYGVSTRNQLNERILPDLPGYKAPEQYSQSSDARADIYGLGATCYSLLTGTVPINAFVRKQQVERGQTDPLQPVSTGATGVPLHVSRAIHRSLSIHPGERFSSVDEFWQALQTAPQASDQAATTQKSLPVDHKTVSRPEVSRKHLAPLPPLKRNAFPLLLMCLILFVSAGIGIWSFAQNQLVPSTVATHVVTPSSTRSRPQSNPDTTNRAPTPTGSTGTHAGLAGSYAGTIVNIPAKVSAAMILQSIHQSGSSLSGYFTAGAPFKISGPFSGTIDASKNFRFTVTNADGQLILFVEGAIQTPTSLSGDYYKCASPPQGQQCTRSTDSYGIWNALLVTS